MTDSFIQLQPDSTGKQVDTDSVGTSAGTLIYRQRAALKGDLAERLDDLYTVLVSLLAVQRAQLLIMNQTAAVPATEDEQQGIEN